MISEKCCILEKSRKKFVKFGENSAKFWQNLRTFGKNTAKISAIFNENFEIRERCKGVHCVDLGESFPTHIYLQKSASIQPRTSPSKFRGKIQFNIHFTPYKRHLRSFLMRTTSFGGGNVSSDQASRERRILYSGQVEIGSVR